MGIGGLAALDEGLPMSSELLVTVDNVSKAYQSYRKPIHRLWQSLSGDRLNLNDEFLALQGVSLELRRGETVGIVGKNGSGKSTLLQIVAGTLQETSGEVHTKGRISALLELGAGFNPDFTGMENARLNASILGLSREEFRAKLPDIVEFSGLGEFMHRPVKTYSSGMYVRLAFSVAINMQPDILIIDEALAVGDIRFQRKCFRRLEELKNQGVAILFVTHSTESIINYCDRAILLEEGKVRKSGEPKDVVHEYLEMMFSSDSVELADRSGGVDKDGSAGLSLDPAVDACPSHPTYNAAEHRWGDRRAEIIDYQLSCNDAAVRHSCTSGDNVLLRFVVHFHSELDRLIYGVTVKTPDGTAIYGTNSRINGKVSVTAKAGQTIQFQCELKLNLLAGDYFISIGVAQDDNDKDNVAIDRRYDMIHLRVEDQQTAFGLAALNGEIREV